MEADFKCEGVMIVALVIVVVFGASAFFAVTGLLSLHNRLACSRAAAQLALGRLEVECSRRGDLLVRLIDMCRVLMPLQRETLEAVLQARHAVSRAMGAALAKPSDEVRFEQWYAAEEELRLAFERFQSAVSGSAEFRGARHIGQLGAELQSAWERVELFERAYNECAADFEGLRKGGVSGLGALFLGYEAVPELRGARVELGGSAGTGAWAGDSAAIQSAGQGSGEAGEVQPERVESGDSSPGGRRVFYG